MSFLTRRDFLENSAKLSALLAGAAAAVPTCAEEKPAVARRTDASEKLRVAVVGVRGRGMSHVSGFANRNGCVITTICDCDEAVIGKAMKEVESKQGKAPKFEKDIRRVVEDKEIDIISIATPNHWHALGAIWAMQNGKDVYVEKPVSHNVFEGRMIVEAARKYKRICQTGTQSRSNPGMRDAIAYVHSGKLGTVKLAYGLCYKPRGSIGKVAGEQKIPPSIDYDLWCGPAPKLPLQRKNLHYDWHWIWAYGNGDLGNQGIHEMDKARWGLRKNELPKSVLSVGGRFGYVDDGETANTQLCVFDYGDAELIFEVRGLPTKDFRGAKVGNIFVGSEGVVVCPSYNSGIVYNPAGEIVTKFSGGGDGHHYDNFVKAVRSRKHTDLTADILEGHLSSALCHLGNISYRLGAEGPIDQVAELSNDKDALDALARMKAHLQDNQLDPSKLIGRVGPRLTLDPATERFVGTLADRANPMLSREYRKGFEVTTNV